MDGTPKQSGRSEGHVGPRSIGDYEDFTQMRLDREELRALVGVGGECVLNWTTRDGYPVGVVMAYAFRSGSFWVNCTAHRQRIAALRVRPQAVIVLNKDGKMATYKGAATIHTRSDPDWQALTTWFYGALSGSSGDPENLFLQQLQTFLDGPTQVIIEVPAELVLSFDFTKFSATIQETLTVDE